MALSTNYKRLGRKNNLITGIRLKMLKDGKSLDKVIEETKNLNKKNILELLDIFKSIK